MAAMGVGTTTTRSNSHGFGVSSWPGTGRVSLPPLLFVSLSITVGNVHSITVPLNLMLLFFFLSRTCKKGVNTFIVLCVQI